MLKDLSRKSGLEALRDFVAETRIEQS
jgi:hypothetical protein